jgi:hypothetical protein
MRRFIPLLLLLLAACERANDDLGPGDVTVGEAKALQDAAAMLEQRGKRAEEPPVAAAQEAKP